MVLGLARGQALLLAARRRDGPAEVVIPVLDGLVSLRGASHVVVSGFTFIETNGGDNIFREGIDGVGGQFPTPGWKYCGEAVHLQAAEGCRIENNRFINLGGNGVYLEGACVRNVVRGNAIAEVGACGIVLGGAQLRYPLFNEITGNHISHPGDATTTRRHLPRPERGKRDRT